MTIYILCSKDGEYDGFSWCIEKVYSSEEKADEVLEKMNEAAVLANDAYDEWLGGSYPGVYTEKNDPERDKWYKEKHEKMMKGHLQLFERRKLFRLEGHPDMEYECQGDLEFFIETWEVVRDEKV